jgi:hypothetical protein
VTVVAMPQSVTCKDGNIMKEILLTKGKIALVDDDDYEELSKYKWSAFCRLGLWYAIRKTWRSEKPRLMHRYILGLVNGDGKIVDHVDRNPLNNTKSNLRLATYQQNTVNCKLSKTNTSGFRGICKDTRSKKERWRAGIQCNGKTLNLGMYPTKEQAAQAYDYKAKQLFGDFINLNFPNDIPNKENVKYPPTKKYLYSNFLNFTFGIYDFYLLSCQYIPPKIKILKQCGVKSVYKHKHGGINNFKNFLDYIYRNSYIQIPIPPRSKSGFYGVQYNKRNNNWLVTINHKHIGRCRTSEDAAKVYDATVWRLYGDRAILNFPNDIPDPLCIDKLKNKRYNKGYLPKSGFRGVCQDRKTKKFISKIEYNYHIIHLGSYDAAEMGAKVYDYAANALFGNQAILNFPKEFIDENSIQYTFQKNKSQLYFCLNFLFGYPVKFGYKSKEKLLSRRYLYKIINLIYDYPINYIYKKPKEIEIKKHHINKILNLIYGYPLLYNYLPQHSMKIRKHTKKKIFKDKEVGKNLYNFITFTYQSDSTSYQYLVGWIHRMREINREEL